MENQTAFDLNGAIQRWRANLGRSPAVRSEDLDELEGHLRDSTAALQAHGLSIEEAFRVALGRIGRGGLLETEFAKINSRAVWCDRILWMLIGIQVWGWVGTLMGTVTRSALSAWWGNLQHDSRQGDSVLPGVALFSLAQLLAMAASVALCWWLFVRKGAGLGAWLGTLLRRRSTLAATGAGLALLALAVPALAYASHAFLARSLGHASYGSTLMYHSYSQAVAYPIQVLAMIIVTLALARNRLRSAKV